MRFLACTLTAATVIGATALAGCAGANANTPIVGTTSITSSEITSAAAPASDGAALTTRDDNPAPGRLVCRAKDPFGVVNELVLEWQGSEAKGVLRRLTPSGNVEEQRVNAERYKGLVIADAPGETDLMNHVAIVDARAQKRMMRTGTSTISWSACE